METFSALLAICVGNSPVPGEFPAQRPVTRSFDVFFDLRLNKRLSKQSWGWWFETLSLPLWRHCNAYSPADVNYEQDRCCNRNIIICIRPHQHCIYVPRTRTTYRSQILSHRYFIWIPKGNINALILQRSTWRHDCCHDDKIERL